MTRESQANPAKQYISKEKQAEMAKERGKQMSVEDVSELALADLRHRYKLAQVWGLTEREAFKAVADASAKWLEEVQT